MKINRPVQFSSVQSLSHVRFCATPWTLTPWKHARASGPSPTPRVYLNSFYWVRDAMKPSHPLSSPFPSAFHLSQHHGLFQWVSSLHQVAKVLEFQHQHQSFQWTLRTDFLWVGQIGYPWCSSNSQESSPTSQLKSINSSVLRYLYSSTVTSIHGYWKNHSFD